MNFDLNRRQFVGSCTAGAIASLAGGLGSALAQETAEPPPARERYDVIVVGLGAMGAACAYQLARRGASVLGLEHFDLAHALGSSGGLTRQTKVMPYLSTPYEPLIRRANEIWDDLQEVSGVEIFHRCGYLKLGAGLNLPAGGAAEGLERLDVAVLAERYPQFENLPAGTVGLLDPAGGVLRPERAIAVQCQAALAAGAHLRAQEPISAWNSAEEGITVTTDRGTYRAEKIVFAAGAWNSELVPHLADRLEVTRLALGWFAAEEPEQYGVEKFPIWEHGEFYGFPILPDYPGCKVARHWRGDTTQPDALDRQPSERDETMIREYLARHQSQANGDLLAMKICMYVHGGPWLGYLPGEDRALAIAACNGGGFKFSAAYGEALAELALAGETDLPVEFLAFA